MTCTIVRSGLVKQPLSFYHHLRHRVYYTHRSAVASVLMFFSPSKEDLYKRLKRRRKYYEEAR